MESGHGQNLSTTDFQPAAMIPTDTSVMLSDEESSKYAMVSIFDTMPTYAKELIAGGAAGGIAKTIVAPLERVKILYQTRYQNIQCLGVPHALRFIRRKEGFLGFYKGNGASVMRVVPYAALHFMAYEQYRRLIITHYPWVASPGAGVDLLAGSMAGGTAVLCTYPLDLARTRLAYQVVDASSSARVYTGVGDVFSKAFKESGVRGLYRGVGPTLYGMLPYSGLKFYIYEKAKASLPNEFQSSIFSKLVCGAVAGLIGQTIIYPLDVVRRQMQVQSLNFPQHKYSSTLDGLLTIIRTQGVSQLYSGLSINHIKLVPSVAIGFAAYDVLKTWLRVPPREAGHPKSATS